MSEDAEMNFISKCSAVVVDVAGTTTSIEYVKETLFPYAEKYCDAYFKENFDKEEVKKALKLLKDDIPDVAAAVTAFKELLATTSDNEGLKIIQGFIYKDGYGSKKLKAPVFSDVPSAFETWAKSMKVAIYSTGSAESQQLLFSHTTEGDLSAHVARYFDLTSIGLKTEKDSYAKIAKELDVKPDQVVFISDDIKELKAAKAAKLITVLVKREGNAEVSEADAKEHCVIGTFADLVGTGKRKCPVDETTEIKEPPTKLAKTEECSKGKAATEEATVTEKTEDIEKMEVDSTTESKKEETAPKPAEDKSTKPEEDTKMETKEADKVVEPTPKENSEKEKEAEITSTNEEQAKKPVDEKCKSQTDDAKEAPVVDSTETVVAPATTTKETVEEKPTEEPKAVIEKEEKMVVDAKTAETTKADTEKTDNVVVDAKTTEEDKIEEKPDQEKEKEKETAETSKTVADEVPSVSNGKAEEKDAVTEEVGEGAAKGEAVKVDEKENKSELANGNAENGNENGDSVVEEAKKADDEKTASAEDIKVKKMDDGSDSTAPVTVQA